MGLLQTSKPEVLCYNLLVKTINLWKNSPGIWLIVYRVKFWNIAWIRAEERILSYWTPIWRIWRISCLRSARVMGWKLEPLNLQSSWDDDTGPNCAWNLWLHGKRCLVIIACGDLLSPLITTCFVILEPPYPLDSERYIWSLCPGMYSCNQQHWKMETLGKELHKLLYLIKIFCIVPCHNSKRTNKTINPPPFYWVVRW